MKAPSPSSWAAFRAEARRTQWEHWLASFYAPRPARDALLGLALFAAEVRRIPGMVSEVMLAEVRLQWWREVLQGERSGEVEASPLASALAHLSAQNEILANACLRLIEVEIAALGQPAPANTEEARARVDESDGFESLTRLALLSLPLSGESTKLGQQLGLVQAAARLSFTLHQAGISASPDLARALIDEAMETGHELRANPGLPAPLKVLAQTQMAVIRCGQQLFTQEEKPKLPSRLAIVLKLLFRA